MKKTMVLLLKILAGLTAVLAVLLVAAFAVFHTSAVQNSLLKKSTRLLGTYLQTKVSADSVSVSLLNQELLLYGLKVEDKQERTMLQMEELGLSVDLWRLMRREVLITSAKVGGLSAHLYKPAAATDSTANYQFLFDALKRRKAAPPATTEPSAPAPADSTAGQRLAFRIHKLHAERITMTYNDSHSVSIGHLHFAHNKLDVDSLRLVTDNHRPRKNSGKPHRGAFDPGHFDVVTSLSASLDTVGIDTIAATLTRCTAEDRGSSLSITDLRLKVAANKRTARLSDVTVSLPHTTLAFDSASVVLPDKKTQRPLSYTTSLVTGSTLLKDIAKPFAPVLANFTVPLTLQTTVSGDSSSMSFGNVVVGTTDRKLTIKATGRITDLNKKKQLHVHFDVRQMSAQRGTPELIINQFVVKKFMMKQLHALGHIAYTGHFDVVWKTESFAGQLTTEAGPLTFRFTVDGTSDYLDGTVQTHAFELGKVMDMPDLGNIACTANFKFDISKQRTAVMRRSKGGKLPIGHVDAEVEEANYKKLKVRNIMADINSDGAVAEGAISKPGKHLDLVCNFSFTNTNEMKKTKVKPRLKLHR